MGLRLQLPPNEAIKRSKRELQWMGERSIGLLQFCLEKEDSQGRRQGIA